MAFKGCAWGVDWQHCLFTDNAVFSSMGFLDFATAGRAAVQAAVKLGEVPVAVKLGEVRAAVKVAHTFVLASIEISMSSAWEETFRSSIQASYSAWDFAPAQNDHRRRHQLLGYTGEMISSSPLPPIVSTDKGSTAFSRKSQEPPPEPF